MARRTRPRVETIVLVWTNSRWPISMPAHVPALTPPRFRDEAVLLAKHLGALDQDVANLSCRLVDTEAPPSTVRQLDPRRNAHERTEDPAQVPGEDREVILRDVALVPHDGYVQDFKPDGRRAGDDVLWIKKHLMYAT